MFEKKKRKQKQMPSRYYSNITSAACFLAEFCPAFPFSSVSSGLLFKPEAIIEWFVSLVPLVMFSTQPPIGKIKQKENPSLFSCGERNASNKKVYISPCLFISGFNFHCIASIFIYRNSLSGQKMGVESVVTSTL